MEREKSALKLFVVVMSGLLVLLTAGVLRADQEKASVPQSGFYLSLTPSVVFPFSVETTSPGLSPAETRTKWGAGIGGGLGYRYRDFRVEGEVM